MYKKHVRWLEIEHLKLNEHVQVSMHTIKHMYTKNIQDGVSLAQKICTQEN